MEVQKEDMKVEEKFVLIAMTKQNPKRHQEQSVHIVSFSKIIVLKFNPGQQVCKFINL